MGDQGKREIFRRYWTRRGVVGVLAQQVLLMLNRQKKRSHRHSQIADLAARRDGGISTMLGGQLGGPNRFTRRFVSVAGLTKRTSVPTVS